MKNIKLNIGCGNKKLNGYINIDINHFYNPDMIMDISKKWLFENDSVDEIVLDNIIEHLDCGIMDWINEAKRVLKPNGTLKIVCPNCFHWKARLRYLFGEFGPNSGYHYDHRWLFKPSWLKELLIYNGFEVGKIDDLFDSQINILARKRL